MTDTIITVEGFFESHHSAERGTALLSAGFEGPDRASVLRLTGDLHRELAAQAERLEAEGAVTWWSADRMRVWSDRPWNQDGIQLPLVHHASVALEVKFADLTALAGWVEQVATEPGVTVSGIDWALTEATETRLTAEARHGAVRNAVDRATAYAESLGLATVRALALADPGMLGGDAGGGGGAPAPAHELAFMAARKAPGGGGDEGIDLKPEEITVTARAHARFAAS